MPTPHPSICPQCEQPFSQKVPWQKFCGAICRGRFRYWKDPAKRSDANSQWRARHGSERNARRNASYNPANPFVWIGTSKQCFWCAQAFQPTHKNQKFCQDSCRISYQAEQLRKRQREHPEKFREKSRRQYRANPKKHREYRAKYVLDHPEAVRLTSKIYQQKRYRKIVETNPEELRAKAEKRRARIKQAPINDLTPGEIKALLRASKGRCSYCGKKVKKLTIDHITPIAALGPHTLQNIVIACDQCNKKKHTKPPLSPVQPYLLIV